MSQYKLQSRIVDLTRAMVMFPYIPGITESGWFDQTQVSDGVDKPWLTSRGHARALVQAWNETSYFGLEMRAVAVDQDGNELMASRAPDIKPTGRVGVEGAWDAPAVEVVCGA